MYKHMKQLKRESRVMIHKVRNEMLNPNERVVTN
eukprot:COSAG02_NODE_3486_length_6663_cov_612.064138_2_plen_34_part_00